MFSVEASTQSVRSSLRNPRRRPRDSDGLQQQSRRKRSKLNDENFHAPSNLYANGNSNVKLNGHAVQSVENSVVLVDMPVREKKAPLKRAHREDDKLYLTRNVNYSVKKLSGFPSALLRPSTPFRGTTLPAAGLALALTFDRAYIWDYNNEAPKVISIPLHLGSKLSDPLPFGAIVRNGPTNDFGLVAVAPSSGKITFWENIESADAGSLYPHRQHAVEGTIKLYSGEIINELVDVVHAGHVLVLSGGRLARLTLRDSQGRAAIITDILDTPHGSGSFFSLKGLLGGGARKAIVAVKARAATSKGNMEVISLTRLGLFQFWKLSWTGQHRYEREIDVHANILSAMQADISAESRNQQDLHVLDFAIMEHPRVNDTVGVLVLVALYGKGSVEYSLLEVDLSQTEGSVQRSIHIKNFSQSHIPKEPTGTLLLPQPEHTAYVYFPGAIFVASLAKEEESPEAQLLADAGRKTVPFQDTVYFRQDIDVVVSGTALDQLHRSEKGATAVVFVQSFGMLHFTSLPPAKGEIDPSRLKVTVRSKLEQATLYGTNPENIIDFSIKSRFSFSETETAQAAIDISTEILSSAYISLENATWSMDAQFKRRASALRTLIARLRSDYTPLPFDTRWRLLSHAEKLAATHKLWNWYQEKLQDKQANPDSYPEKIVINDIVLALNERYKTPVRRDLGETDTIRQFFLKDVDSLSVLIPWAWSHLRIFYIKEGTKDQPSVMQRLSEGTDVVLVSLETAFAFRKANMESYGLDPQSLNDGILESGQGYDVLPHFWTSSHNIVSSIRSLVDVGRNLALDNYEEGSQEVLAQKIAKDNPRLVKIGCQTHIERFRWALAQSDEKTRETGRSLKEEWNNNVRPAHILGLGELGLAAEGMSLAEQYRDMPTLVDLIWDESTWLESEKVNTRSKMEQAESTVKLNRIKERINRYFEVYGDKWASSFYSKFIQENQAAQLFAKDYLNQPALTKYLRGDPSRARLRWINEVCGEANYEAASEALYDAASKQESNSWCQRVELSMAKLAMLCTKETKPGQAEQSLTEETREPSRPARAIEQQSKSIEHQLEYAKIQDQIYEHLMPVLSEAADDEFAVDLLMNQYGQGRLLDRLAHQSILREGFENLIHHKVIDPALMIDVLTLLNTDNTESVNELEVQAFTLALRVLVLNWNSVHRTTRDGLHKLIWKRLSIKDNWPELNKTKDLSDVELQERLLSTYVGWTFQGLCRMISEDQSGQVAWPKKLEDLVGVGCTHGELCVRFSSEDVREPIIKDNQMDDDILREYLEKHRLEQGFLAACKAGKQAFKASLEEVGEQQQAVNHCAADVQTNGSGGGVVEAEAVPEPAGSDTL